MGILSNYLKTNDFTKERKKLIFCKEVKELNVEIRALTEYELNSITDSCTKISKKSGISVNQGKLKSQICIKAITYPDFNSTEDIEETKSGTPENLLAKTFSPGIIAEIYTQISMLSGFDRDMEEDISEVKNS